MTLPQLLAAIYVPVIIATGLIAWRAWYIRRDKGAKVIKLDDHEKKIS
jgi:hypothetical protein